MRHEPLWRRIMHLSAEQSVTRFIEPPASPERRLEPSLPSQGSFRKTGPGERPSVDPQLQQDSCRWEDAVRRLGDEGLADESSTSEVALPRGDRRDLTV